jgi:hypothetical protein
MVARIARLLLAGFWLACAEENYAWNEGESLMDDPPAAEWKEGESLMDDPPSAGWQEGESLMDDVPGSSADDSDVHPDEITFGTGLELTLTKDIVFDETGNVKEGGSITPDISFWHVVEFNGERLFEPTQGSEKVMAALESGEEYTVKFAPPDLSKLKCTEKVTPLNMVLEEGWHDMAPEMVSKALATLAEEGVMNTKQLGDLWEKDYDAIKIPAIIKSRLRAAREEARRQAETAANPVTIDSEEVASMLEQFTSARGHSKTENATVEEMAQKPVEVSVKADAEVSTTRVEDDEEDGTLKSLVWAIMNCPTCKGKETVTCLRSCRYGEESASGEKAKGGTWSECLDKCITNRWIRATFSVMLPKGA